MTFFEREVPIGKKGHKSVKIDSKPGFLLMELSGLSQKPIEYLLGQMRGIFSVGDPKPNTVKITIWPKTSQRGPKPIKVGPKEEMNLIVFMDRVMGILEKNSVRKIILRGNFNRETQEKIRDWVDRRGIADMEFYLGGPGEEPAEELTRKFEDFCLD
ncbi:MAG: hypothetical protein JW855_05890 [Gammaproteobacteria bacterium]|nr:hypothetical protein [Gammaproteobacteria bacterium]